MQCLFWHFLVCSFLFGVIFHLTADFNVSLHPFVFILRQLFHVLVVHLHLFCLSFHTAYGWFACPLYLLRLFLNGLFSFLSWLFGNLSAVLFTLGFFLFGVICISLYKQSIQTKAHRPKVSGGQVKPCAYWGHPVTPLPIQTTQVTHVHSMTYYDIIGSIHRVGCRKNIFKNCSYISHTQ